jgi:hypothetical protein
MYRVIQDLRGWDDPVCSEGGPRDLEDPAPVRALRGPSVSAEAKKVRARKMIRELRTLGYRVELIAPAATA